MKTKESLFFSVLYLLNSSKNRAITDITHLKLEVNEMVKDPVCKMDVDEKKAKFKSDYNGKAYYFCSATCKTSFDKNPTKYIK
jgi:YHS domain-containing protein